MYLRSRMLNMHIDYSIHTICPRMYSHNSSGIISHAHALFKYPLSSFVVLKQCPHRSNEPPMCCSRSKIRQISRLTLPDLVGNLPYELELLLHVLMAK
jgi:hypothetical protein